MMIRLFLAATLSMAACGGADTPAPEAPAAATEAEAETPAEAATGEREPHEHEGEDHEHSFPPAVTAFHDVLSPNWHAEKGPARIDATCAAVASMAERADAVKASPAPEGVDAGEWTAIGDALIQSVASLGTACEADGRPDFDPAFTAVHDAFHAFVDIVKKE